MNDRLTDLFDAAIKAIEECGDNPKPDKVEDVITRVVNDVLSLGAEETGPEIDSFFQEWYNRHWALKQTAEEGGEISAELSYTEQVLRHVKSHYQDIAKTDEIFKWLAEAAPKSIPPTIIYYALTIYANAVYGFYCCTANKLYGGELPGHDHEEGGPTEED